VLKDTVCQCVRMCVSVNECELVCEYMCVCVCACAHFLSVRACYFCRVSRLVDCV